MPADIYHRYLDLKGVDNIYVCGSDVHGTPLALEAHERGIAVEDLADEQHEKVKKVLNRFEMDFDIYSNTHCEHNKKQTHDMFEELYCNGHITEKTQKMAYSETDGRFLPDRYVEGECPHCGEIARGDQCDECGKLVNPEELGNPYSTISGAEDIEFRETTHLFLDLPQFKEELTEWIENADPQPVPDSSIKEVKNSIEETEPRAITRDIDWGFEIPVERVNKRIEEEDLEVAKLDEEEYGDKVLYVWFDAPIGYIGFTRELFDDKEEWKDYWMNDRSDVYYSIGKDNTIFHTVIWPSMLIGSSTEDEEYNLPHYEFIQQYLMAEDTQFSKSKGTGLSTEDALDHFPADYWRFYLASELPRSHDTKFSLNEFEQKVNTVLNDTVGNFVNRTLSLAEQWFDNEVPEADLTDRDREIIEEAEEIIEEYEEAFEDHNIKLGLEKAVELARLGDRYLSSEEPWNNEDRQEETISISLRLINACGVLLYPYMPETSERAQEMLNVSNNIGEENLLDSVLDALEEGRQLGEREILFEKIEVEELKTQQEENDNMTDETEAENVFNVETVSFEDFQEMDLRVGKIVEVDEHPNADKLYKVQVDVGETTLQTCAGLKEFYEKDELIGKTVVVLANLEPAELRGEKSECMMLAADNGEGNVALITPEKEVEKGSEVR